MNEFQATAVIVALFALRCIVPVVLMAAIGYGMKWLVRSWEKADAAIAQPRPSIPLPTVAPARQAQKSSIPCWVFNNCDEKTRNTCPAYMHQSMACWLARLGAEGRVPAKCAGCSLYSGAPAFVAGD